MVNKTKRVILSKYKPFTFISAPFNDESCSFKSILEKIKL